MIKLNIQSSLFTLLLFFSFKAIAQQTGDLDQRRHLPTDVNGNENNLNSYIYTNETALATGTVINAVNSTLHRIMINNISQAGFITAVNLCAISNNVITTSSSSSICGTASGIDFDGTAAVVPSSNPVYQWQKSINNGTWINITPNGQSEDLTEAGSLTSGTYSYRRVVSDPTGCSATDVNISNEITITVTDNITGNTIGNNQIIGSSGDPVPFVETTTLSGGNGTFQFQWQSSTVSGGPYTDIVNANSATYDMPSGLSTSTYFVREVTSGSCSSVSNEVSVTVTPLSTISGSISNISMYPNPIKSSEIVSIDLGSNQFKTLEVFIINSTGATIYTAKLYSETSHIPLNMNSYQKGIYLIQLIMDENKTATYKIIKE